MNGFNSTSMARFGVVAMMFASLSLSVVAQEAPVAEAADTSCFLEPARLSGPEIQSFLDNPNALLTSNAVGGLPLQNAVRSLVGSSSLAFDAIMALVPSMNADQAAAVGAGMARVVNACSAVDPDFADLILAAVGELDNQDLLVAFSTALQETAVGAIGGPAGGQPIVGGTPLTDGTRNAPGSNPTRFGGDVRVLNGEGDFIVGSAGNFVPFSASPFAP